MNYSTKALYIIAFLVIVGSALFVAINHNSTSSINPKSTSSPVNPEILSVSDRMLRLGV